MIKVTCRSYDLGVRVPRTLATFEDGNTAFDQEPALSKAIYWLEDLLGVVKGSSLLLALDEVQIECNLDKDPPPFPSKAKMPLCILNLVLKEHGLQLEEG